MDNKLMDYLKYLRGTATKHNISLSAAHEYRISLDVAEEYGLTQKDIADLKIILQEPRTSGKNNYNYCSKRGGEDGEMMENLTMLSEIDEKATLKCLQESCGEMSCDEYCCMQTHNHTEEGCSGCEIQKSFEKLHAFEQTGLTPSQIIEMNKLYQDLAKEVAVLHECDRWIPVGEKMPEENIPGEDRYDPYASGLVSVTVKHMGDGHRFVSTDCTMGGEWDEYTEERGYKVLAWKSAPEEYKEDQLCIKGIS